MLAEELPSRTNKNEHAVKCVKSTPLIWQIMGELLERCLGLRILLNRGFEVVVLLDITSVLRKPH